MSQTEKVLSSQSIIRCASLTKRINISKTAARVKVKAMLSMWLRSHDLCLELIRKDLSASLDQKTVMVKLAAVVDWQDESPSNPHTDF